MVDAELGKQVSDFNRGRAEMKRYTALSRNCCCSLERGRRRFAVDREFRVSGAGSVFGDAEEVVADAYCFRDWLCVKLGSRKSHIEDF